MPALRIAQVANFVSPTSGGMKVAIDQLGRGYAAAGAERLLLIPGETDRTTVTDAGTIVEVGAPKISSSYRMILDLKAARAALESFGPTSIECSDKWSLTRLSTWAAQHRVGTVLLSHERLEEMATDWVGHGAVVRSAVRAWNRRLADRFDIVVVTSRYSGVEFERIGAHPHLVPLGVDLDNFHPSKGHPPGIGPVQLVHVGRMSHEKYPQLAVASAVELHRRGVGFQLNMYGTGPDIDSLRKLAGDAPVTFHGLIADRAEVARRLAASDISLSVCPTETFGLALLEALACGTPVITADRGGARELVDESCAGWGSPDAISIADAVENLIARRSRSLRHAARSRAEQYPWSASVERMLDIHATVTY